VAREYSFLAMIATRSKPNRQASQAIYAVSSHPSRNARDENAKI